MPSGVYPRTKKHLNSGNFKKGRKISKAERLRISKMNSGPGNHKWKGGRIKTLGYIEIYKPNHPNKTKNNRIKEHRYIAEQFLGRFLKKTEHVHHINHVKDDNRLENLMVFISNSAHRRFHKNPSNVKLKEIIFDGGNL